MVGFNQFDAIGAGIGDLMHSFVAVAWVLIPLAGIAWFIISGLAEEKTARHNRELLHRERMIAMEKGMTEILEKSVVSEPSKSRHDSNGLLVGGIITLGVGIGLSLFLQIAIDGSDRRQAVAVGLIPIFVGLSLIIAWLITRRLGRDAGKESEGRS
jgi:hypothetical protein